MPSWGSRAASYSRARVAESTAGKVGGGGKPLAHMGPLSADCPLLLLQPGSFPPSRRPGGGLGLSPAGAPSVRPAPPPPPRFPYSALDFAERADAQRVPEDVVADLDASVVLLLRLLLLSHLLHLA